MNFYQLSLIALALSLDAFGVALSIGLNEGIRRRGKFLFMISFGGFQFLFSMIGAIGGVLFTKYIATVPSIIGGSIIIVVGALMIKEAILNNDEKLVLKPGMYIVLGISVSIDAMVIGFTAFNYIREFIIIFEYTVFIGIVSFIMTFIAFVISKYLRKINIIAKYSEYIGGIILVLFGIKMIFF